jgi:hypothetical protein
MGAVRLGREGPAMAATPELPDPRANDARNHYAPAPGARIAADAVARRREATRKARSGVPPNALADAPWRRRGTG